MSIFMKATMKVEAYKAQEFVDVLLKDIIPVLEEQGWRLHGCFVERFGSVKPAVVVDIWEMKDMDHVESVMKGDAYRNDERYLRAIPLFKAAVLEEHLTFMEKRGGHMACVYQ